MRATFLQYRSPKEETPFAYHSTNLNDGRNLNRFEQEMSSESKRGTFSINDRFNKGSIYDLTVNRTQGEVGPGSYRYEDV